MSFEYNSASIAGNLTRDAEMRTTKNGKPQVTFTVANNRSTGQEQQTTTYFRCIWFGDVAGKLAQYLTKGKPVFVVGPVELNEYEGSDGTKRASIQIVVRELQLLPDGKGRNGGESTASTNAADVEDDDDVPF